MGVSDEEERRIGISLGLFISMTAGTLFVSAFVDLYG